MRSYSICLSLSDLFHFNIIFSVHTTQLTIYTYTNISLYIYLHVCMLSRLSSVQLLSCVQLFVTPGTVAHQASLSFTISRVCSNSCPLSQWCHPSISSSAIPFSCLQSFPASGSFPMNWLFASGGQRIGASASASVPPMNIQDWFPLGLTGLNSLKSTLKSLLHHSSKASNGLKETNNREHLLSNYYV